MMSYSELLKANEKVVKAAADTEKVQMKYFQAGVKAGGKMIRVEAAVVAYGQGLYATHKEAYNK